METSTTASHSESFRQPAPTGIGSFTPSTASLDHSSPDLTHPEQYYRGQGVDDGLGPERALMYAVLKDGIRSFYKNVGATRRKYKKVYAEAEQWLCEDNWDEAFSFRFICDTIGIDAGCLRKHLLTWRDDELDRQTRTGEQNTKQVGRSPFPSPIDLDCVVSDPVVSDSVVSEPVASTDQSPTDEAETTTEMWNAGTSMPAADEIFQEEELVTAAA